MDAYFHYEFTRSTKKETFFEVIHMQFQVSHTIIEKTNYHGYVFVEDANLTYCSQFFQSLCQDLYYDIFILLSYADDVYSTFLFSIAKQLTVESYSTVGSLTLQALIQQNTQTIQHLNILFSPLSNEDILTIDTFLQNEYNTTTTSRDLFIHRNTLRYRLQSITDKVGMDMRSFLSAQLFYYWRHA